MIQQNRTINGSLIKDEQSIILDVLGLSSFGIQISGTFSATLQFEGSIDGLIYTALTVVTPSGTEVSSATAAGVWTGNCAGFRFVRVRVSAYTSGSVVVYMNAALSGGGSGSSIGGGASGATYNDTQPTYSDGDTAELQTDVNGNLRTREMFAPVYEDNTVGVAKVEQRFGVHYVSTATTTVVKSGAGLLHSIVVQGGTAGTIIVYDNTAGSGKIIASFDSTNALQTYIFDSLFATGLTVVTSAATKLSVNFR